MERIHSPIGTHSWNKKWGYNYKYDRAVEEHMHIKEDKKNHTPDTMIDQREVPDDLSLLIKGF